MKKTIFCLLIASMTSSYLPTKTSPVIIVHDEALKIVNNAKTLCTEMQTYLTGLFTNSHRTAFKSFAERLEQLAKSMTQNVLQPLYGLQAKVSGDAELKKAFSLIISVISDLQTGLSQFTSKLAPFKKKFNLKTAITEANKVCAILKAQKGEFLTADRINKHLTSLTEVIRIIKAKASYNRLTQELESLLGTLRSFAQTITSKKELTKSEELSIYNRIRAMLTA